MRKVAREQEQENEDPDKAFKDEEEAEGKRTKGRGRGRGKGKGKGRGRGRARRGKGDEGEKPDQEEKKEENKGEETNGGGTQDGTGEIFEDPEHARSSGSSHKLAQGAMKTLRRARSKRGVLKRAKSQPSLEEPKDQFKRLKSTAKLSHPTSPPGESGQSPKTRRSAKRSRSRPSLATAAKSKSEKPGAKSKSPKSTPPPAAPAEARSNAKDPQEELKGRLMAAEATTDNSNMYINQSDNRVQSNAGLCPCVIQCSHCAFPLKANFQKLKDLSSTCEVLGQVLPTTCLGK